MEPSNRCRGCTSCSLPHHHHFHHHHHRHRPLIFFPHHHHWIVCPHHHHHHHHHQLKCRGHVTATLTPLPRQNFEPFSDDPLQSQFNLRAKPSLFKDASGYDTRMVQGQEYKVLIEEAEEEDEEPIFVLTDEWKEFFAASEAKRKQEKKQAKKK